MNNECLICGASIIFAVCSASRPGQSFQTILQKKYLKNVESYWKTRIYLWKKLHCSAVFPRRLPYPDFSRTKAEQHPPIIEKAANRKSLWYFKGNYYNTSIDSYREPPTPILNMKAV